MIRSFLIVLICATPMLADREEANLQRTIDSLQGTWGVKSMQVAGTTMDPVSLKSMRYTFDRDVLIDANRPEDAVRLNLDVSSGVAKMETLDRYGNTREGLIRRSGDSIVMCYVKTDYGTPRQLPPKDFRSTKENGAVLMQLTPIRK
ncbi:MAG TPA: hypothetical protein VHR66_07205 [Gemmataceae bacterium]|jgi:uncharacterized protein (TIGR03067 family)|nr:hypothetical protein [Gemmataceae bacterium]